MKALALQQEVQAMAQVLAVPYVNLHTGKVTQRYFAFILNINDQTLWLNSSGDGGASWSWKSLGGPPPGGLSTAAATSFFSGKLASDGSAINQFYVFILGNDGHLWLVVSLDDGSTWAWQDQGVPSSTISGNPEAVSQLNVHSPFEQDVFCHVIGNDGHLYVNSSEDNGKTWNWADRGTPPTTQLAPGEASTLAYFDGTNEAIYAFAVGNDSQLYTNFGDGTTWNWLGLGQPSPSVGVTTVSNYRPTSLTVPPDAAKAIWVFVIGTDGHLYASFSPSGGTGWVWLDRGVPPGTSIQNFLPNALRVGNESKSAVFNWNLFVFAMGADFQLHVDSTPDATPGTGAVWTWDSRGAPSGTVLNGLNGAVASTEVEATLASVQMFVFVSDDNGSLYLNEWDGSKWTWHNQLGPP
jgi:hypothetical protein